MKRAIIISLIVIVKLTCNIVLGQEPTPLYAGHVTWTSGPNELDVIDTTGGGFTVIATLTMVSDFGPVEGCYGLALEPASEQMYILYQSTGGSDYRRIGSLDTETGEISDIAVVGNLVDIDFGPDGTLYGTTGSNHSDYSFLEVDPLTGATTFLFNHLSSTYGSTIAYNPFENEMIHISRQDISTINLGTLMETDGEPFGHMGEANCLVILTPTLGYAMHWGSLYTFNPSSGEFLFHSSQSSYHAMAFGELPCVPISVDVSAFEVCEGEEVTLDATGIGEFTWDGGVIDAIPFIPGPVGTYEYTPTSDHEDDCALLEPIDITVLELPIVLAGAGDLNFCEDENIILSASGNAHEYEWNDGEELELMPGPGTYTFTLVGAFTEGGCLGESTDEVIVTVHALPIVTASADDELICIGTDLILTGGGGEAYEWDIPSIIDATPFTPTLPGPTTYHVIGTDEYGCVGTASITVEIIDSIIINGITSDEIFGEDGELNITFSGGQSPYLFDWDNDEAGDFDDEEDLTGLVAGTYTVIVKGTAGCQTIATYTINSQLSILEHEPSPIQVYPNPTFSILNIEIPGAFTYELIGENGTTLLRNSAINKKTISLKDYANGVYFITVVSGEIITTVQVIKK